MKKNKNDNIVNVTKSYLPPLEEYVNEISILWENHYLTNYGQLNNKLVNNIKNYLKLDNIHYVTNGTISLQLAINALNIESGEIITTPFTYIATLSSILWQRCTPVFVDINEKDFNIDVTKIEKKITTNTKAIMAVHCFGIPCNVVEIDNIAKKNNLKVIYDAAHSFGTMLNNKSVLSYGDISCCSFHATKVFHTVEGGLCVGNNDNVNKKMEAIKKFGMEDGKFAYIGLNAKNSELHAAMGLCVLRHIDEIIKMRKSKFELYKKNLSDKIYIPALPQNFKYNYIYFPVVFSNESQLLLTLKLLNQKNIFPRRYFYPCVNSASYIQKSDETPIAESLSKRIICLPLDTYISNEKIIEICNIINRVIESEN